MQRIILLLLVLSLCTCVRAQTDTSNLWQNADLTGHLMKPYPISEKVLRKAQRNNLPWTAVAGTVAAGGVIGTILIKPKENKFPPNTVDDELTVLCDRDFVDLFPLRNDISPRGRVIDVVIYGGQFSAQVLNDSMVRVSNFSTLSSLVFGVRISSEAGVSNVSDFMVSFLSVPIITRPDAYEVVYRDLLTGNLLENDEGSDLELISIALLNDAQPRLARRITFQANGDFAFDPRPELRGTARYRYTVRDKCGNTQSDTLSISVIDSPCGFAVDFGRREDVCGIGSGFLEARVENGENLIYAWSSGQNVARADGLSPGIYQLTITDPATNCSEVITEEVGPGDPNLEIISSVSVDHCTSPPVLSFGLGGVRLDNFEVELAGNGLDFPPRPFSRGNRTLPLEDISPGTYDLIAYPAGFPDACRTVRTFTVFPPEPVINFSVIAQTPPCMGESGSITLLLERDLDQTFNISIPAAMFSQTISGDTVFLTGFNSSTYDITVFNGLNCPSAPQSVTIGMCFQGGITISSGLFQPTSGPSENNRAVSSPFPVAGWDISWLPAAGTTPFGINARFSVNPESAPADAANLVAEIALLKPVYVSRLQDLLFQIGPGLRYRSNLRAEPATNFLLTGRLNFRPAWPGGWQFSGWANYVPYGTEGSGFSGGVTLLQPLIVFPGGPRK